MSFQRSKWTVLALVALVGCGKGSSSGTGETNYDVMRGMGDLYGLYLREHNNLPPADQQAFRDFLSGKQDILGKLGLTVDAMFVSPRREAPLNWVYGRKSPRGPTGLNYIAYETTAVDGKRFMLAANGMYEDLDETQFRKLFPQAP